MSSYQKLSMTAIKEGHVQHITTTLVVELTVKFGYSYNELHKQFDYECHILGGKVFKIDEDGNVQHECQFKDVDAIEQIRIKDSVYHTLKSKLEAVFND